MTNPLKPILAGLDAKLGALERRAQAQQTLLDKVRTVLPAPENEHVISAVYRQDALVITADSAVWSARLRYCQAVLHTGLTVSGETPFTKLRVRVGRPAPDAGASRKSVDRDPPAQA